MSRAFTRERDDAPEPVVESHVRGIPVHVTPSGRLELEARLTRPQSPPERQRLQHLVDDLVVIEPPQDRSLVAFGATVDVHGGQLGAHRYTVVGAEEADVASGRISDSSPLGTALLGAHVGDRVRWHRPAGDVTLTIVAIAYDDVAGDGRKPA